MKMNAKKRKMKVTYYGHGCLEVECGGKTLLVDPFISPNPLASGIDVDSLMPDYILVTHGHEDHVADLERIAKQSGAQIISNYEIVSWCAGKGLENGWPMNHGGKHTFDFGTLRYVNAVHSSVLPDGSYGGNPGGFILNGDGKTLYIAGDTALHMDMELIGRHWTPDFAVLPIGDNFTMGYEDAVICSDMIRCNRVLGMHYDTFPFIEIDKAKATEAFNQAGKELHLPAIGQTVEI